MRQIRYITRKKFCEATHVSKEDPVISVYLGGQYWMPALGIIYLERKDDEFTKYYVKLPNGDLWKFTPIEAGDHSGTVIHHFKPITSERFASYWKFVKVLHW